MTDQLPATQAERPRPAMTVGGNVGALIPQDIEQAFRIAQALAHSGMTPNGFKTPETCFVAIMAGAELGLPPFQSLQSFAIINGRPTLYGAALMAVIRTNGFKLREWYEGEGDDLTAFCEVTRPDNGDVNEASYSVADAKTAKLWGKAGPWVTNWKRMLQWRARGFAFTDGAADVLKGLQIREAVEGDEPLPSEEPKRAGSGLLAKLQANETLATEGFGIRDVAEEAGEAAPAPEPKPKRGRPAKAKPIADEMLDAIAEAEPEIVQQVVADHGQTPGDRMTEQMQNPPEGFVYVSGDQAAPKAPETPADAQVGAEATTDASAAIDGPAPADTVYFMADDEIYPSGRRAVYFNGLPNGVVEATDDHPIHTQHAPAKAKEVVQTDTPTDSQLPETTAIEPESAATTDDQVGFDDVGTTDATDGPFAIFDEQARNAKDWPELSAALTALSRSPEWKTDAEAKRSARVKAWAIVNRWNEDGAKLDPASSPNLLQIAVTAWDDPEMIQGLYATAQTMPWLAEAEEAMQTSVSRFVIDRLAEIRGA